MARMQEHGLIAGYASSGFGREWQERLSTCIQKIEDWCFVAGENRREKLWR